MTFLQQQAVRCALVDMIGSLREWQHDWRGHLQTIEDLAAVFPSLGSEFNTEIDTLCEEMRDATD